GDVRRPMGGGIGLLHRRPLSLHHGKLVGIRQGRSQALPQAGRSPAAHGTAPGGAASPAAPQLNAGISIAYRNPSQNEPAACRDAKTRVQKRPPNTHDTPQVYEEYQRLRPVADRLSA